MRLRWHQLLNDTNSFLETSVTAMAITSIVRGVRGGLLPKAEYDPVIKQVIESSAQPLPSAPAHARHGPRTASPRASALASKLRWQRCRSGLTSAAGSLKYPNAPLKYTRKYPSHVFAPLTRPACCLFRRGTPQR